jgi:DNA helicase HerA-like ATPase
VIEEARVLIPKQFEDDRQHPATASAIRAVRRIATEGRKMGLGLMIVSQKPSGVDAIPISQCNTLILHRVINPEDLNFVRTVGESISDEDLTTLKIVDRGISLVTGTALKLRKTLLTKFRMRLSEEGRRQPTPLMGIWS